MKFLLFFLLLCQVAGAQGKIIRDSHPLIGKLNGNIKEIEIIFKATRLPDTADNDTTIYSLNQKRDTATYINLRARNYVDYHIYDSKGKIVKYERYKDGTKLPPEPSSLNIVTIEPGKQRPYKIEIRKSKFLNDADTTKYYYDKNGNLIRHVLTNSGDDYVATDTYQYDARGNEIEEKKFAGGSQIGEKNRLTSIARTVYKYDAYGNWVFKEITHPNIVTNKVSEGSFKITIWRKITYR